MSIISQRIHTNELSRSGLRRSVRFMLTDHLGKEHLSGNRRVDASLDINDLMAIEVTRTEANLAEDEEMNAIGRVESGEDALVVVDGLSHGKKKKAIRRIVRWAMKSEDVYHMLSIKPIIVELKSRFSGHQIADFLGITGAQLTRLNTRYNKIIANESDLGDVRQGENFK